MNSRRISRARAFTLVELVMVVMIIGMISSMAIPRFSRASGAAPGAALGGTLNVVRTAILMYAAEHGNTFPGPTAPEFVAQLTQYSDAAGNTSPTRSTTFGYGPYLASMPIAPVGRNVGSSAVLIDATHSPPHANTSGGQGWVYNPNTGEFYANTSLGPQVGVILTHDGGTETGSNFVGLRGEGGADLPELDAVEIELD